MKALRHHRVIVLLLAAFLAFGPLASAGQASDMVMTEAMMADGDCCGATVCANCTCDCAAMSVQGCLTMCGTMSLFDHATPPNTLDAEAQGAVSSSVAAGVAPPYFRDPDPPQTFL